MADSDKYYEIDAENGRIVGFVQCGDMRKDFDEPDTIDGAKSIRGMIPGGIQFTYDDCEVDTKFYELLAVAHELDKYPKPPYVYPSSTGVRDWILERGIKGELIASDPYITIEEGEDRAVVGDMLPIINSGDRSFTWIRIETHADLSKCNYASEVADHDPMLGVYDISLCKPINIL